MFGIRLFLIGIVATAIAGGGFYVFKLQKDNAILKANAIKQGANAVLGYNMNLTTTALGSKNYVIVSVTGTAVETA